MTSNSRNVVLHVSDTGPDIQRALAAAALLASSDRSLGVRVIVNGPALEALTGSAPVDVPERTAVAACEVGMGRQGISPGALRPGVQTVPSAVVALAEAQFAGAAYIRI